LCSIGAHGSICFLTAYLRRGGVGFLSLVGGSMYFEERVGTSSSTVLSGGRCVGDTSVRFFSVLGSGFRRLGTGCVAIGGWGGGRRVRSFGLFTLWCQLTKRTPFSFILLVKWLTALCFYHVCGIHWCYSKKKKNNKEQISIVIPDTVALVVGGALSIVYFGPVRKVARGVSARAGRGDIAHSL